MEEVLLEVKSVSKKFEDRYVLENVDMRLENCQFIAILGHSGSGKSTMLNILSSVLRPSTGYVFYKGRDITKLSKKEVAEIRREYIGLVFQHYMLLPNLTIRENIEIGNKKDNKNINLEELCTLLGIQHLLEHYPYHLSGGEQQRACIARAVIKKP
ncbi:ABC transporter ATP-binding protein [Romboutsia ilealis]|jgi:putative ABC transport system ATP-binding protein|uniref:ABC transporter ATP-binding protein n=3 Tax=Romboutsia ilealis TaxID=1115758 RepID=UPI00272D6A01|nr:ATP-binding cassette domain-containing protein [Romboutsia ilealis]